MIAADADRRSLYARITRGSPHVRCVHHLLETFLLLAADTPVFQGLSFTVGGGRTGLVAPNGGGKSTLLKLIAGEYRPSGGTESVEGVLGYLPQTLPLAGDLTVAEVLGIAPGGT